MAHSVVSSSEFGAPAIGTPSWVWPPKMASKPWPYATFVLVGMEPPEVAVLTVLLAGT